jgi:hypothetical protein
MSTAATTAHRGPDTGAQAAFVAERAGCAGSVEVRLETARSA